MTNMERAFMAAQRKAAHAGKHDIAARICLAVNGWDWESYLDPSDSVYEVDNRARPWELWMYVASTDNNGETYRWELLVDLENGTSQHRLEGCGWTDPV